MLLNRSCEFFKKISNNSQFSSFEKLVVALNLILNSFAKGLFMPSLVESCPVVLGKISDRQTDKRTTNKILSEKLTRASRSGELKTVFFFRKQN